MTSPPPPVINPQPAKQHQKRESQPSRHALSEGEQFPVHSFAFAAQKAAQLLEVPDTGWRMSCGTI
jgi:hypothetical protein